MPDPHKYGSFSYKTINKKIKQILDARSNLNNTVQLAMPFVKATTTLRLKQFLKSDNNFGFTLGLHAFDRDILADSMYSDNNGDALIGYTYTDQGTTELIYAPTTARAARAARFFNQGNDLYSNVRDKDSMVPPPGITNLTIGRNKSGLLAYGDLQFSVPTLAQLEILHRTFLIPGVGMVLEWGQRFAAEPDQSIGEYGLTADRIRDNMFPWHNRSKLVPLLDRLGRNQVGLEEILECYVYPTQGQYMWMFGRVANFSTKANSDGSFNCNVKIVGPSEDAWAYSTRNTVVPPRDKTGNVCIDGANSVESYFNTTTSGLNLKSYLDKVLSDTNNPWNAHVVKVPKGNKKEGNSTPNTVQKPNPTEATFADSEDAYFMSWRFLVNKVLNDETDGVKAIFKRAIFTEAERQKISMLRPYKESPSATIDSVASKNSAINDEYENYVGANKFLRSTDASTLIIVNKRAVVEANLDLQRNRPNIAEELTKPTQFTDKLEAVGTFYDDASPDKGFLSTGVWINHKALVQCMVSSDTILRGIINLLDRMNAATNGYWQLTLDASEPIAKTCGSSGELQTDASMNYSVIDANYRGSSDDSVREFLEGENKVHVFNKYIRRNGETLVGSELLECEVDLSLPKRMFSQIATLGLVQEKDLQAAGATEQNQPDSPLIGDPNEALREMFAITTLNATNEFYQGPDLTIPSAVERKEALENATCGSVSGGTTAGAAGSGNAVAKTTPEDAAKPNQDLEKQKTEAEDILKSELCKSAQCQQALTEPAPASVIIEPGAPLPAPNGPPYIPDDTSPMPVAPIRTGWGGRRLSPRRTRVTFEEVYKELRSLGASEPLIISIMATMYTEQPNGNVGYKATNFNFAGVDLTNGAWTFDPNLHDGYTVLQEGGTKQYHAFASFRSLRAALAFKKSKLEKKGFGSVTNVADFAKLYYTKWNGLGFRTLPQFNSIRAAGGRNNDPYGTPIWKSADDAAIALATKQYNYILNKVSAFRNLPVQATPVATTPRTTPRPTPATSPSVDCSPCVRAKAVASQTAATIENNSRFDQGKDRVLREFPFLKDVFRYLEPYPDLMVAKITRSADGNSSNAFGASPGTLSISADLSMPGINGFRVGELFWIDRIPAFYRAFGAFQILSIEDTIGIDGWKTKIHSRFNYLGKSWKQSMFRLLGEAITR